MDLAHVHLAQVPTLEWQFCSMAAWLGCFCRLLHVADEILSPETFNTIVFHLRSSSPASISLFLRLLLSLALISGASVFLYSVAETVEGQR